MMDALSDRPQVRPRKDSCGSAKRTASPQGVLPMYLKALKQVLLSLTMLLVLCGVSFAVSTSQSLKTVLKTATDGTSVGRVIVTFQTTNGLQSSHLATLQAVGILKGRTYPHLGMV